MNPIPFGLFQAWRSTTSREAVVFSAKISTAAPTGAPLTPFSLRQDDDFNLGRVGRQIQSRSGQGGLDKKIAFLAVLNAICIFARHNATPKSCEGCSYNVI